MIGSPKTKAVVTVSLSLILALVGAGAGFGQPTSAQIQEAPSSELSITDKEAQPGETVTVTFTLKNTGDQPRAHIVGVGTPDGFTIKNRSDDGASWNGQKSEWLFQTIQSGDSVSPSLTLKVPEEASGEYTVTGETMTLAGTQDEVTATINVVPPEEGPEDPENPEDPEDPGDDGPTDPDDDGLYEDVNGDGEFDITDVQALFATLDDETIQNNPDRFDFNQDGVVNVVDVQKLFGEVLS